MKKRGRIWKDVQGFEGYYQVSDCGEVRSLDRTVVGCHGSTQVIKGKLKRCGKVKGGYNNVMLYKGNNYTNFYIHRLVATHFLDNSYNLQEVNHIDGNKSNNNYWNLEWCTRKHNEEHAIRTGLKVSLKGEECSSAKLTNEQAIQVYRLAKEKKFTQKIIGDMFGIVNSTVSQIKNKVCWKEVTDKYDKGLL